MGSKFPLSKDTRNKWRMSQEAGILSPSWHWLVVVFMYANRGAEFLPFGPPLPLRKASATVWVWVMLGLLTRRHVSLRYDVTGGLSLRHKCTSYTCPCGSRFVVEVNDLWCQIMRIFLKIARSSTKNSITRLTTRIYGQCTHYPV